MEENADESDAIDSLERANKAVSVGPFSALLAPSFKIIGTKFGEWTEAVFNKRRDNLKEHTSAVHSRNPELHIGNDAAMASSIEDWADSASNYGDDSNLSSLWKGVLEEILKNTANSKIILEIAKQLDHSDLELLERLNNRERLERDARLDRLVSLNAVVKREQISGNVEIRNPSLFVPFVIGLFLYIVSKYFMIYFVHNIGLNILEGDFFIETIPIIISVFIGYLFYVYSLAMSSNDDVSLRSFLFYRRSKSNPIKSEVYFEISEFGEAIVEAVDKYRIK